MAEGEGGSGKRLAVWIASGAVVLATAAVVVWLWRSGGALPQAAEARAPVEECSATVSGSTAMTPKLAPEIATAFLRGSGYETTDPVTTEDGGRRIVGTRGHFRCTIEIRTTNTAQAFHDLAENKTLVALAQRPVTPVNIAMLREAGAGDFAADRALAEHVVAFDAYAVTVHASNPVRTLSTDDIRDIVLGVKTNWKEFGGPDLPFVRYTGADGVGPEDYPNDLVPYPNPIWQDAREHSRVFATEAETVAALKDDPAGFGSISMAYVLGTPGVRALNVTIGGPARAPSADNVRAEIYPFVRRLFVYVRPADMRANSFVQRFVAFFRSPEAFDIIDGAGFVALRPESRISRAAVQLSGCRYGTAEYSALMSATSGATRLPVQLRFVPDTMRLDEESRRYIQENADSVRAHVAASDRVVLIGHTDVTGEVARNRGLALGRALAVRTAFERQGVLGLEVESAGEQCPIADNDSPDGQEQNRRVEIWVRSAAPATASLPAGQGSP